MMPLVAAAWSLFLGMSFIMLGNGLQSSLLGIRAVDEGFSTTATGIIMAGYFAGFLFGSLLTPRLVRNVGHVRVFAALASIASTAILLHLLFVNPVTWAVLRLLTGFCYAGLYVVAESWINERADNETRGQIFAIYMIIVLGGMSAGQFLLTLGDPGGFELFVLSSVLISLALVPILLSAGPAPAFAETTKVGFAELYRLSPLGVVSSIGVGLAHGTIMSLGAVYAGQVGLSVKGVAVFMAAVYLGGLLLQWPLGRLSDRFDRRTVLAGVAWAAAGIALLTVLIGDLWPQLRYLLVGLMGGTSLPLYSITVAHTNDNLRPEQMVGASGTIYIFYGIAATTGPILAAFLMDLSAPSAFFAFIAVAHGGVGAFALYRMTCRAAVPLAEQQPSLAVTGSTSSVATAISVEAVRDHRDSDLAAMSRSRLRRR
jgi:MFS family permease